VLEKALAIRQKSLGADNALVADTMNNLAMVYAVTDRQTEAEQLLHWAMVIRDEKFGANSPQVAEVTNNLGNLYLKEAKYTLAKRNFEKALNMAISTLGDKHPIVPCVMDGLADTYKALGRNADADKFAQSATKLKEEAFGSNAGLVASIPHDCNSLARFAQFSSQVEKIETNVREIAGLNTLVKINRPFDDKWALVIGISQFKDPSLNLKYAAKDAKDFADFLVKEAHFAPDHVHLLTDQKATRENILAEVGDTWLPHAAGPDDLVIIYVSSHGSPSDADARGMNYLITHNTNTSELFATGISMQQFSSMVRDRVHSDRVLMILDACHSGSAGAAHKGIYLKKNFDAEQVVQGSGQMVICSSAPSQTSWESAKYPNGVFTHHLIEGLRLQGDKTKLPAAFEYLQKQVCLEVISDRGEKQEPQLKSNWSGESLVIAAPPAHPRTFQSASPAP
jgi:tetratricopeptide (TPR) repeat protein